MKIDKVIFVSDSNINYLSFWNSVSKYYSTVLGLPCKLFFIGVKDASINWYLSEEYGEVQVIPDIPIIIQALWAKFWFTQTEPDTNWLIGDIDLYILDKDYLISSAAKIPDDGYGHIHAVGTPDDWYFPGYSHVASGRKFKEYLELTDSFEDECRMIQNSKKYGCIREADWVAPERVKDKQAYEYICSEEHLTTERLKKRIEKITILQPPNTKFRLETPYARHGHNTPDDMNLVIGFMNRHRDDWLDFHCPRPYTKWSGQIEYILNAYLSVERMRAVISS